MENALTRSQFTIDQEIIALKNVQSYIKSKEFNSAVELLQNRKGKIIFTGLGKSSYISQKLAASMTSLGHGAIFLHPTEAFHGDMGNILPDDVLIALSFSGETKEVVKLAQYANKNFDTQVISINGNSKSSLANMSTVSLNLSIEKEGCAIDLAPMASAVATLALGDCLISAITEPQFFSQKEFARFHPGGSLGLKHTCISEVMQKHKEIPIVKADVVFTEAVKLLNGYGQGVIGLIDNDELVGVLTDGDIRRAIINEKNDILRLPALELASKSPYTIHEEASLNDALSIMESNKITSLFVKRGKIIGFVHLHSVLTYLE